MKKRFTLFFALLLMAIGSALAQQKQVSGVVISSEDNEPVIGASVTVKGLKGVGAQTNVDGKFSFQAPVSAKTLVISCVGMETKEVAIKPNLRIILNPNAISLEEFVVTGYGSARKISSVTGSVAKVSSKSLQHKPVSNVMESLQGQIAGLQVLTSSGEPTAVSSLTIHGVGSLGAGTASLYILDGAPVSQGALISMNQDDFESIQVMKDASATAIYGARAANGVVYITSKKGARNSERGHLDINLEYGISQLALKNYMNPMNSAEILDYQLKHKFISQKVYDQHKASGIDTKWRDYMFKKAAPLRKMSAAFSGGGKSNSYYISGAYYDQEGVTIGSFFEKYTARANFDSQINPWIKFGLNISGSYDERETFYGGTGMSSSLRSVVGTYYLLPYYTPYDENGKVKDYIDGPNMLSTEYILQKEPGENKNYQMNGVTYLEIRPIKNLVFRTNFGMDWYHYLSSYRSLPSATYNKGKGSRSESFSGAFTQNITNTLEYMFKVGGKHDITLLAGHEGIRYQYNDFGVSLYGMTDDRLMMFGAGGTGDDLRKPTQSFSEYKYLSFFGRGSYSYNDKYFADITLRNDASSRFGSANRNAVFYSIGTMWNVTRESFMKNQEFINDLRIKASYGTTGNSSIGNYDHLALIGTTNYGEEPGWAISTPGNNRLSWEEQKNLNLGVKASMFKNRLSVDLDYYIRDTEQMLMDVPQAYSSGVSSLTENIGKMRNSGIDLVLSYDFIRSRDWNFNFRTTFNYNRNEIRELFYGYQEWIIANTGVSYRVGKPVEFYYPKWLGVDPADGKQMWEIPGTNESTKEFNRTKLEQPLGKYRYAPINGGFSLSGSWRKGIYMQADFAYVLGKWMINNDRSFAETRTKGHNMSRVVLTEWEKPGQITDMPKFGEQLQFDSRLLENASFMRLKNLSFGYQLPKSLLPKNSFVTGMKLVLSARNLFTITKYSGVDPEVNSNLTYGRLPNTRQYIATFQINL